MVFGAMVATILCSHSTWFIAPTRLVYQPARVSDLLRVVMGSMAFGALLSGTQDAWAAFRLRRQVLNRGPVCSPIDLQDSPPTTPDSRAVLSSEAVEPQKAPKWMQVMLTAAGIYNLIWGVWVIMFPTALFRWTGMPPINYPQIWQCVGMIVGVYGVGYLIAASNPYGHWAIVLVGLLGKILGPAGMWWFVNRGDLPFAMAWTCLTNDLIWWLPFAATLLFAFKGNTSLAFGERYGRNG
jgi:hypothetical protein